MITDADMARALTPLLSGAPPKAAARLHALNGGVHCTTLPSGVRLWIISRHHDVKALLADPRLALNKAASHDSYQGFGLPPALDANLLNLDGADHSRLRRLVASAFTNRRIDALRDSIHTAANSLLDALPNTGRTDLLTAYAAPLPVAVICDLLGAPADQGTALRECTQIMLAPDTFGPEDLAATLAQILRLLTELIAAKRAEPTDDLLSAMITARDGNDRLNEDELLSLAFLILFAGYENSVHLITSATARLLTNPARAAAIRAERSPHTPGMHDVIEDFLRWDQPLTTAIRRFTTEPVDIGETTIPAGDTVLLALAAANHDPAAPAHVSFGHGPHYCLGAPLARLEVRTALWTLMHRLPDLALAVPAADLTWKTDHRQHVLTALPVTYAHRSST